MIKQRLNLIVILIAISFNYCFSQSTKLPNPSGKYFVGTEYLSFTDSSRKELFDNNLEKYRDITAQVWYPTDVEPENGSPYFYNADLIIKYFDFPEIFREIETNSSRGAAVSQKEKEYPVLIFNHGWGEHYAQNTILMEELASHGYIVFSIAHHYECKFSFYPDGKLLPMDIKSRRFLQIWQEMQKSEALKLLNKMDSLTNIDEQKQTFKELSNDLTKSLNETPKYWTEDISFFINNLKNINLKNELCKGKLDLNRIGVFGMSMGGIATTETCISDNRVKAGINIDGGLIGSEVNETIKTPFMFLNSEKYLQYGKLFTNMIQKDGYSLSVKNTRHYNFTDYSLYKIKNIEFLLGTIEGEETIKIMNKMVLAFFDKYVKQEAKIDIISNAKSYPEINITTNF